MKNRFLTTAALLVALAASLSAQMLGGRKAVYDSNGTLLPWTGFQDAIDREMRWYLATPVEHGYPRLVYMTFMDGDRNPVERRPDFIPAMQNGMGIISYLKYYRYQGRRDPKILAFARAMGDYIVDQALTPDTGKYPRFPRSTGWRARFPQPPDSGSQNDRPYEVQPDKGAIAGYALALLYSETRDEKYLKQALHIAQVLAGNMGAGGAASSPWPFRVDYRTGEPRGPVSANMSYILRLFDQLKELGHDELQGERERLWTWIRDYQIPDLAKEAVLWAQFFEDHDVETNRNAWSPLNLARYLIEKQGAVDTDWKAHAKTLIDFVIKRFTSIRFGVVVCGEQDRDLNPWGGILSTYGAVLAMYSAATGAQEYMGLAHQALTLCLYAIDDDGCPHDSVLHSARGGWQEDAHTDVIHNYVDALAAFPQWAK